MKKVIVIATSHNTRGGITSVVKAHQMGEQWNKYHCIWIETHIDKNIIWKLFFLIRGWLTYIILLPFYDLVHIHVSEPISALRKCLFFPFAKMWQKKVIIHFHAFSPDTTINGKYKKIYKYLFTHADRVIVLSQLWKKYVNNVFNLNDKVQVIYNPCTTEILDSKYKKQNYILYAGTINSRKGYSDMIKAFAKISSKYENWKIVFAGNGEIEKGKALAQKLGIQHQTIFLGWVNGELKDKAFKEATIFCLPSYAEGFPMAVLDAFAYGLPVITTPVGGIPDIAKEGVNMLLFNAGDINTLSQQIDLLIENKDLRESIQRESLILAKTIFNLSTINKQIEDLYDSLINKHYIK